VIYLNQGKHHVESTWDLDQEKHQGNIRRVNWFYVTLQFTGCIYAITKIEIEDMPLYLSNTSSYAIFINTKMYIVYVPIFVPYTNSFVQHQSRLRPPLARSLSLPA
jgi:hypothetical protein